MNYQGTSDLIWQADIRVSTFASGLVLVQRGAMCRKTGSKRDELPVGDPMPAEYTPVIDGLFIFPAPQETRTPAYTTYDVSAYGRTRNTPLVTKQTKIVSSGSVTIGAATYQSVITAPGENQAGVITATEEVPIMLPASSPVLTISYRLADVATVHLYPSSWFAAQISRTNYGAWDEYLISWEVRIPTEIVIVV